MNTKLIFALSLVSFSVFAGDEEKKLVDEQIREYQQKQENSGFEKMDSSYNDCVKNVYDKLFQRQLSTNNNFLGDQWSNEPKASGGHEFDGYALVYEGFKKCLLSDGTRPKYENYLKKLKQIATTETNKYQKNQNDQKNALNYITFLFSDNEDLKSAKKIQKKIYELVRSARNLRLKRLIELEKAELALQQLGNDIKKDELICALRMQLGDNDPLKKQNK